MIRNEILFMQAGQSQSTAPAIVTYPELTSLCVVTKLCAAGVFFDRLCERGPCLKKHVSKSQHTASCARALCCALRNLYWALGT